MNALKDRRVIIAVGSVAALLVVVLLAVFLTLRGRVRPAPPVEAQRGMLQVEMGKGDGKLDPAKPLRCFVGGQFVGEETLAECAKKNGVAAQNLDVGLDTSGQVAAAGGDQAAPLAPLTPPPVAAPPRPRVTDGPQIASAAGSEPSSGDGECLAFANGSWRPVGDGLSLQACVHLLYDGRCVRPGDALYGRFGSQTLRSVPGRIEISGDNRAFRFLVAQDRDCNPER